MFVLITNWFNVNQHKLTVRSINSVHFRVNFSGIVLSTFHLLRSIFSGLFFFCLFFDQQRIADHCKMYICSCNHFTKGKRRQVFPKKKNPNQKTWSDHPLESWVVVLVSRRTFISASHFTWWFVLFMICSNRSHISISSINSFLLFLFLSLTLSQSVFVIFIDKDGGGVFFSRYITLPIAQEDLKELFGNHQYPQFSKVFQQQQSLVRLLLFFNKIIRFENIIFASFSTQQKRANKRKKMENTRFFSWWKCFAMQIFVCQMCLTRRP